MEILVMLGVPLAGGALLAIFGGRHRAPELGIAMSFVTFLAAILLTTRVISDGPITAFAGQFFIDPFNVVLVALTTFVAFTTSLSSRRRTFIAPNM